MAALTWFYATVVYRLSHQLWKQHAVVEAKVNMQYYKTGIIIRGARIGASFLLTAVQV